MLSRRVASLVVSLSLAAIITSFSVSAAHAESDGARHIESYVCGHGLCLYVRTVVNVVYAPSSENTNLYKVILHNKTVLYYTDLFSGCDLEEAGLYNRTFLLDPEVTLQYHLTVKRESTHTCPDGTSTTCQYRSVFTIAHLEVRVDNESLECTSPTSAVDASDAW